MGLGDGFKNYFNKIAADKIAPLMRDAQKTATIHAIKKAVESTPPNVKGGRKDSARGNAVSRMADGWDRDSTVEPIKTSDGFHTILANLTSYASFVNDGHQMDKHFVPGLFVQDGELLYKQPNKNEPSKGIMVGTKTRYVKGYHMKEKAKDEYERRFKIAIEQNLKEYFNR